GIFTRARHIETDGPREAGESEPSLSLPLQFPLFALNRFSISAFNKLYAARPGATYKGTLPYQKFFFPLDGIANWNRMYGSRGFFQHQSLLPPQAARTGLRELLETIGKAGQGSFLAVLKRYGPEQSPGVMTFGGEGYSLALDFANKGKHTRKLLRALDAIVVDYGGRIYPAKDATMWEATFKTGYPRWDELEAARDPALSSSFWRRVVPESTYPR
ncbi:MAG: FAD-binding protein, partial [Rhizobiaceae bacterium]